MKLIETLINGLSIGSTYAMIALGYTMVYGIAKMLNFAHGDVIMVGGYFAYEAWLLGYGLAAAASVPGNAAQGVAGLVVGVLLCQTLYHIPVVKRTVQMF